MAGKAGQGEAVVWLRMGDADRETYGGPEWVAFEIGKLFNTPASQLEQFEAETGIPLFLLLHEFTTYGSRATRCALFIARRMAGETDTWAKFDPCTLQVKRRDQPPAAQAEKAKTEPGKSRRARSATSPRGSAGARSAKSSTTSAPS